MPTESDDESKMAVYSVILFIAYAIGVSGTCLEKSSRINRNKIATMCHDSVVDGTTVFIDTDLVTTMTFTSDIACSCSVQAQASNAVTVNTYFGNAQGITCSTWVEFRQQNTSTSFDVSCIDYSTTLDTDEHGTISVGLRKSTPTGIGNYCIAFSLQPTNGNTGTRPLLTVTCTESQYLPSGGSTNTTATVPTTSSTLSSSSSSSPSSFNPSSSPSSSSPSSTSTKKATTPRRTTNQTTASDNQTTYEPETTRSPNTTAISGTTKAVTSQPPNTTAPSGTTKAATDGTEDSKKGDETDDDSKKDIIIAGVIVGILAFILIIVAIIYFCRTSERYKHNKDKESLSSE